MRRKLLDCQLAITRPNEKAVFSKGRVGLMRKNSSIYIITVQTGTKSNRTIRSTDSNLNDNKFKIEPDSIKLLPAAIELTNLGLYLFIRRPFDKDQYSTMLREIKVLLKQQQLRQNGKGATIDKFIATIPMYDELDLCAPINPTRTIIDGSCVNIDGHVVFCEPSKKLELNEQLKSVKIRDLTSDKHIPRSLWSKNRYCKLEVLELINCQLGTIPKELELFSKSLISLNLSDNKIDKLPRTFCCKMFKLRYLNLNNNQIENIPLEVKFLSNLQHLELSHNKLRMLPSTFSDLKLLNVLNVSYNRLSQLPAFRSEDIRLQELDVSYNPFDGATDISAFYQIYPSLYDNDDENSFDYLEQPIEKIDNYYLQLGQNNYNYNYNYRYNNNQFLNPPQPLPPSPILNDQYQQKLASKFSEKSNVPSLFELTLLKVARDDQLFKLASEKPLPSTIVSTIQRDIFKCYRCRQLNLLPAFNSTDILDYLSQVNHLEITGVYRHEMKFMKLLCKKCFHNMTSM